MTASTSGGTQAPESSPAPPPRKRRMSTRERAETRLFRWFVLPVTYGIFRLIVAVVNKLSPNQAYGMARGIATIAWWFSGMHRGRVLRNIELAYGDQYTPKQRVKLARRVMEHFFMTVFDIILVPRYQGEGDWRQIIECTQEQYDAFKSLADYDGPVALHTGHMGSWEASGSLPALLFRKKLSFVYRPLDHPQVERDVKDLRESFGQTVFPKQGAFRSYAKVLKQGGWLGVIADQNAGEGCAYLDFFGVPAATEIRYFPLYQRFNPKIACAFALRDGDNFRFKLLGPFMGEVRLDADPIEESIRLGQWYLGCVEQVAREYPEQYLWTHKRYARRPAGVPSLYSNLFKPIDPAVLAAQPKTPVPPETWKVE